MSLCLFVNKQILLNGIITPKNFIYAIEYYKLHIGFSYSVSMVVGVVVKLWTLFFGIDIFSICRWGNQCFSFNFAMDIVASRIQYLGIF